MKKIIKYFISFFALSFLFTSPTNAAVLFFDANGDEFSPGETIVVRVKIDTEGECVNVANVKIVYDNNVLKFIDFSKGESIISFWVKDPEVDGSRGIISFAGGVPGGYCGRLSGEMGENNILGKIIFQVPGMMVTDKDSFEISFSQDSEVFINDGLGTKASLGLNNLQFSFSETPVSHTNVWKEEILNDNFPPEQFEITIMKDPYMFNGKYFAIFQTSDKQTGIDHYEIKEGDGDWKFAESPYLLEKQKIQSIIKVRAVDKSGNERIAEYIPEIEEKEFPWQIIPLILLVFGVIIFIIYRLRRK